MSTKLQTIVGAWIGGISAFISWLATVPPESQTALLGPLVDCMPLAWRPTIGLGMRALATASTIYAVYKAAHSGPQTPPKNPPQ